LVAEKNVTTFTTSQLELALASHMLTLHRSSPSNLDEPHNVYINCCLTEASPALSSEVRRWRKIFLAERED
jgi:hypothetical protein